VKAHIGGEESDMKTLKDRLELKPGIGIGSLVFGASRKDVERLLGKPSSEEVFESCEKGDIRWFYSPLQLNIYFFIDYSHRMCTLETTHIESQLWGTPIIGLPESKLLCLFTTHNCRIPEVDLEGNEEKLYRFDELECNVYVENGVVTSIQMGVLFDNSGNLVKWPEIPICEG
jgi:hypothetical protein